MRAILGWSVLGAFAACDRLAFIDGPRTFIQVLIIGLSNGALYALIALGYTMVYGIIELINFAHGDLFMIGSVLAAIILEEWLNQTDVIAEGMGAARAGHAWRCMAVCALFNVVIEKLAYRRLRKAPEAGAAHHRRRRQLHPPEHRHFPQRFGAELARQRACHRARYRSVSIEIRIKYIVVDRASPFRCCC